MARGCLKRGYYRAKTARSNQAESACDTPSTCIGQLSRTGQGRATRRSVRDGPGQAHTRSFAFRALVRTIWVTARIRAELGNKLGGCLIKRVLGVFVQHFRLRMLTVFMVNYREGETFVLLVVFQPQR